METASQNNLINKIRCLFASCVFVIAIIFSGVLFYVTHKQSNSEISQLLNTQAKLGVQFDHAIRKYVAEYIRPFAQKHVGKDNFVPETMSTSFVARSVFNEVRKEFPDYIIKFSSDNPRNPLNLAGPEELEIIKIFNDQPGLKEYSTSLDIGGKYYHAHFRTRRMKESCLQCHGKPEDAPRSLIERYGSTAGFHRPVGEVVALDMVAIPESKYKAAISRQAFINAGILLAALFALLAVMYLMFHKLTKVVNRYIREAETQHNNLLSIFSGINEVIYVSDPISHEMIFMNKKAQDAWGHDRLGEKCHKILQDRETPCPFCTNDKLFSTNSGGALTEDSREAYIWEFQNENNDRWYRCIDKAIRWSDGRMLRCEIAIDIDDNKQHELILKAEKEKSENFAMEAQAANHAKDQFLANMSHELRTPMNAVCGFAEILAESELTMEQRNYLGCIRGASKNLMIIIEDILDLARIESGKVVIEELDCNVEELLSGVAGIMQQQSAAKGIELRVLLSSDLPKVIKADTGKIRQGLLNLVGNAVKFTDAGHVSLMASTEARDGLPFIRFDVEDTGMGIPADKQQMIFDLFSQVDGSFSRKHGGLGLGLAITDKLVQHMQGTLSVKSEAGKGSTFSILMPAKVSTGILKLPHAHAGNAENAQDPCEKLSGKILVVEDNASNQALIGCMLKKFGLETAIVGDGAEALDAVAGQEYDLIIMDIQMPNMSGHEATRILRKKGVTTPIIAVTANVMKGDREKCLEVGCNSYIAKPINMSKLHECLKKHLSKRTPSH